jgi:hypothetical protein
MAIWLVVSSDFELESMDGAFEALAGGRLPAACSGKLVGRVEAADPLRALDAAKRRYGDPIGILVELFERHGTAEVRWVGCVVSVHDRKKRMLLVRVACPTRYYYYDLNVRIPEVGVLNPIPLDE